MKNTHELSIFEHDNIVLQFTITLALKRTYV